LESTGRIIAISTNFPERIDSALIRPGRIDMIIEFRKCSVAILREMICSFYDEDCGVLPDSLNERWTPAEVNQILFRNFKDKTKAIHELSTLTPNELYGFKLQEP
jgi:chaperone BCS1